jgi:hypothetical protein
MEILQLYCSLCCPLALNCADWVFSSRTPLKLSLNSWLWVSECYVTTDGQSVSMSWTRFLLLSDSYEFVHMGRSLCRKDWSVVHNCCWPSSVQKFSGPSPVGLLTIFYSLRFVLWIFAPVFLLMTSRHGPRRKHRSLLYFIHFVVVGLFAKELFSDGCVYPLIKNLLPNRGCCFLICFGVTGLHTAVDIPVSIFVSEAGHPDWSYSPFSWISQIK